MQFNQHEQALMRRDFLELLSKDAGRRCNEALLGRCLDDLGYCNTQQDIRDIAAHLASLGLIRVTQIGTTQIFTLQDRAKKVIAGKERIEGIAEPDLL